MKPFLKYRGGKSSEIIFFSSFLPKNYDTYIEPFFGGGSLFFYLEPKNSIINDLNEKLIKTYLEVRDNFEIVKKELKQLQYIYEKNQREYEEKKKLVSENIRVENKNEDLYYKVRDEFNYPKGLYSRGTVYFFINKTSYSGMVRYNKKGEFNVPFGRYKNFNTDLLREEHNILLNNAKIFNKDYSYIFDLSKENDFIFLDPPYDTTFNDYGNKEFNGGFGEDEQRKLAKDFKNLSCRSLMVIGKTKFIEELYHPYIVGEYDKKYSVNIKNRFKNETKHLIIKNFK